MALALACSRIAVPRRLAGLHRTRVWTGASAARLVARLHDRGVAPTTSAVADYGPGNELRLYLSTFPDTGAAMAAFDAMVLGIRTGRTPFTAIREDLELPGRWVTYGPGGHHMLWVSDRRLYWLQGEPDTVRRAASELPAPLTGTWT